MFFSSLCYCTSVYAENHKILKIVSSLPRTGSSNAQTTSMVNGIRLALEEKGDKVGPYTIKYEDWDDASPERGQWDPAVEAANADKAIADKEVVAYIGTYNSGAAKISMPKLNAASLAMVSPGNSWPGLTKKGFGEAGEPDMYRPSKKVTYFRVFPTDDVQGPTAARWISEMGGRKVYVLHDRELYGKGLADMFKRASDNYQIQIVGFEGIDAKASNYRALATKIRQVAPDFVYFAGTTQSNAGQVVKDLLRGGLRSKMMFPDGCFEQAFIQAIGSEPLDDRVFFTFPGVPPKELTGSGKMFYDAYKSKFSIEPEPFAIYGYEAARVVLDAISRAGTHDRGAIVSALAATRDFEGALGKWSFDENGDISLRSLTGNTIKNRAFTFVRRLSEGSF
jgi:branched-chain amino acid transport system substrate-binding protein